MNTKPAKPHWFRSFNTARLPQVSLYCFPYAGSGPSIFREWPEHVADGIDITGILYPGRESRVMEPLVDDIVAIAKALMPEIVPRLKGPFAFFGHSMGALISFELTRLLGVEHDLVPEHIFMSGAGGPHIVSGEPIHNLSDSDFLDVLIKLNGMPREVLLNRELLEYALPIIRNDFKACAQYRCAEDAAVRCALTALGGTDDPWAEPFQIRQWEQHAPAGFQLHMLEGDHFFLARHKQTILSLINNALVDKPDDAGGH